MTSQDKQEILIDSFMKLDERRKDYIRKLTRKLAGIHSKNEFQWKFSEKRPMDSKKLANNTV